MFITIIIIIDVVFCFVFIYFIVIQMDGSNAARVGVLFSVNQLADVSSLLFVKAFEITASSYRFVRLSKHNGNVCQSLMGNEYITHVNFSCLLCSHKKKVLNFLSQMCTLYEHNYLLAPSEAAESTQAFIDKVCELAEANGLSSKPYRSAISEFSAEKLRKYVNKVHNYLCGLAFYL